MSAPSSPTAPASFWCVWLEATIGIFFVIGLTSTYWIDGPLWAWHQAPVAEALWGSPVMQPETAQYRAWVMSIFGPTLMGWTVALFFVVRGPFRRGERWAWWCVAASTLVWGLPDTAWSLTHGVNINVALNVFALVMVALPLWTTRRAFAAGPPS